ncbi:MAG: hypothetical protein GC153_09190 [Alphaproteobacteria bacterium]|nr:hypothetical protein [Alphaproteobacteria bacterium]
MGRLPSAILGLILGALTPSYAAGPDAAAPSAYKNFQTAIYIPARSVRALSDKAVFDREYARVASQLHFDKVYIEDYRDRVFVTDEQLESVKKYFEERGIRTAGGVTLAAGGADGQFATFDYENPADRAECEKAIRRIARHFDEVILDDFFFFTSKSDADIAAKGKRSWTQYRLDKMREIARELVLKPAREENPNVRMIIKYPNWYEHFQGLGYDLDKEAKAFDGVYTGTETRDPAITDQLLQEYESYLIYRYFSNVRPGANGGGWVDTYDVRFVDRYAEQLWDTMLAKAPEITLFNWREMAETNGAPAGVRPWARDDTSFDWNAIVKSWKRRSAASPGWALAAGAALRTVDSALGSLGAPIGIASYKPYQSSGEDFLHNYLGNIGLPIELHPDFPMSADPVLLTASAAADPQIIDKIKQKLRAGGAVIVTSGLVEALSARGFDDIAEWTPTGRSVDVSDFILGYGAGAGTRLGGVGAQPILFPELRFFTNDSWAVVRGVAGHKGYPILLMNRYSKGTIFMLTVPNNPSDLYRMPQAALTQLKKFIQQDFPVMLDAPPRVSLFVYDNDSFVVQNFRDDGVKATVRVKGGARGLSPIAGEGGAVAVAGDEAQSTEAGDSAFEFAVPPHSFRAFRIAR